MRFTKSQSVFLNLLRGLSALAVMAGHALSTLQMPIEARPAIGNRYDIQTYAVLIFFVLSGLLIAHSALSKGPGYRFSEYVADRFARIFVCLFPTLIFIAIVDFLIGRWGPANAPGVFVANLMMLQRVRLDLILPVGFYFPTYGTAPQLWTVAVEWWLYMTFGTLVWLTRMSWRSLIAAAILAPISFFVAGTWAARESLAVAWFASAASAYMLSTIKPETARLFALPTFIFSAALLVYRFIELDRDEKFLVSEPKLMMLTVATVLLAIVVFRAYELRLFTKALEPPATFLAAISYPLYLTHYTVLVAFRDIVGLTYASILPMIGLSILVAWVFAWAFDRHHKAVSHWLHDILIMLGRQHSLTLRPVPSDERLR